MFGQRTISMLGWLLSKMNVFIYVFLMLSSLFLPRLTVTTRARSPTGTWTRRMIWSRSTTWSWVSPITTDWRMNVSVIPTLHRAFDLSKSSSANVETFVLDGWPAENATLPILARMINLTCRIVMRFPGGGTLATFNRVGANLRLLETRCFGWSSFFFWSCVARGCLVWRGGDDLYSSIQLFYVHF